MPKSSKGSRFEREICKQLSLWYTHQERDDIFWRTAGSGARATVRMKSGKATADSAGDMCAIDPCGKKLTEAAVWELKCGYSGKSPSKQISLLTIVDKLMKEKEPLLIQWFEKLDGEVQEHGREFGFIIFKRDRKNPCIVMARSTFDKLNRRNPKKYMYPQFGATCTVMTSNYSILVMKLEDFLVWCSPETITRKIKRRKKGDQWAAFKSQYGANKRRNIKRRG